MKKTTLEIALDYSFKDYSVIPVGISKKPLIAWKEYQSRRATVEEIVAWWEKYPEAQIGIVCGAVSNLTVIDIESDGDFNLFKDETYTVSTGGGGIHLYFKYQPEIKNSVRSLPQIDTRGDGGYVIAAGSESSKGSYSVLKDLPLAQMSKETLKLFREATATSGNILPWYANSGQSAYPVDASEGLVYEGSAKGNRNDSMAKFAGTVHAKLHPSLWSSIGWQTFEAANQKNNPPLPAYEILNTWKSIEAKETAQNPGGRDYSKSYTTEGKTWGPAPENNQPVVKQHPVNEQLDDPLDEDPKETLHVSDVADLQVIDSEHTYPTNMPPFDEALLGGFSAGELIVVAGQPGHGKTSITQDWSVTLASVIDGQDRIEKLPSLWFSYEVLARPLWNKFKAMGADIDTPIYMPRFNETGDVNWVIDVIEKAIVKWGIKVVCVDHLGFLRAPKGNYSNAADAITNTVRALKQFAVKRGLIIILPVHMRKTNSKNPTLEDIKDSSGIAQEADTVFFIGREKDDFGLSTNQAVIWLVKNRKTGNTARATFDFRFNRFYYNAEKDKKEADSEAIDTLKNFDDWVK